MEVYRIAKSKFINDLSGEGARLVGGRWNKKGTALLYTAQSRALAALEVAVHTGFILPKDYTIATIYIPDSVVAINLDINILPDDWDANPAPDALKEFGESFVTDALGLLLKIPSAVIKGDSNYLINPLHADIKKLKVTDIQPFQFDNRLIK